MTQKEAKELVAKHGSLTKAAKAAGVSRHAITRAFNGGETPPKEKTKEKATQKGKSLADFRAAYDKDYIVPAKIKKALAELGNAWEYESVFVKQAGISLSDMGTYRELFADHVVSLKREGKRVIAGTKSLANQLREML